MAAINAAARPTATTVVFDRENCLLLTDVIVLRGMAISLPGYVLDDPLT